MLHKTLVYAGLAGLAAAQFPPTPEGLKVLKSKFHENVTISYKEPGLCELTPGVKSYAGHVHLPPGLIKDVHGRPMDFSTNTFFWFFEARNDPANAPLSIWLNGGPGGSSFYGLLQENGPCFIDEDSQTTINNTWSWNNHVNMLFIDEPNQVGLSYDVPTNGTLNLDTGEFIPADFSSKEPHTNLTVRAGTFSTGNTSSTVNSTENAAHALWHFAQTFFTEFPHYKPNDDRINLWTESYGGHYGPGFFRFFQQQNEKIIDGTIEDKTAHYLHLDTLGIINGYIDAVIQEEYAIKFPFNNTYGIHAINQTVYDELMHNYTIPGGCRDQLKRCQKKLADFKYQGIHARSEYGDPGVCSDVLEPWCDGQGETWFEHNDNARFDITHHKSDPFPPPHGVGWLAQEHVLQALGARTNFSLAGSAVSDAFTSTKDIILGGFLDAIAYLLDSGIKVHMMYGDRDFACNWLGGEAASLEIPYSRIDDFRKAGYTPLISSVGHRGETRQFGNFSFSRVFQAGHMIPSYQPEAAYDVFMRALFNRDIATGKEKVHDELSTDGPDNTWHVKTKVQESPKEKCYILSKESCTKDVWEKVMAGKAVIKDYFVVDIIDDDEYVLGDGEL